jgi:hypothetical protein
MAEDDDRRLFDRIRAVEWDPRKAASNRRKHGIDFDEAIEVFYGPILLYRSDRKEEERWLAIGESEGREPSLSLGAKIRFGSSRLGARE